MQMVIVAIFHLFSSLQQIPLCDVVEPLDFEDFLLQHQNAVDRDPMRQLLEYPPDDVTVEMLRRHCRTIAPIIPEHGYVAQNMA